MVVTFPTVTFATVCVVPLILRTTELASTGIAPLVISTTTSSLGNAAVQLCTGNTRDMEGRETVLARNARAEFGRFGSLIKTFWLVFGSTSKSSILAPLVPCQ